MIMVRVSSPLYLSLHNAFSSTIKETNLQSQVPPPAPRAEQQTSPREPYPVPSANPASQYTLLEKLGTGSFGTVYKAVHNETKQIVAVKQIGNPEIQILHTFVLYLITHGKAPYRLGRFRRRHLRDTTGDSKSRTVRFRICYSILRIIRRSL